MTLPECVTSWLAATGKKQNAVAKAGGLKASQVSEIASGKINPRWSAVEKLAKGFGVSPSALLAGPRPERTSGDDERPVQGNPVLESRRLKRLEEDAPAEDSIRGDILRAQHALDSAHAALNRALRRADKESGAA